MNPLTNSAPPRELVITRIFNAPVELVWRAWTEPEHIVRWWGPQYFTSPSAKVDLRVGGKYVFAMQAPKEWDGRETFSAGVYTKIVPLERLEFTQGLSDKDGNPIAPEEIGMPADFPDEIATTVTFKALGNRTEVTVTEYGWTAGQMADFSELGMKQSLDKLEASLVA